MSLIAASELIERVRSSADEQNSGFISDKEIIYWLNVGVQEIYDILTRQVTDYAVTIKEYTTVQGQESYLLPDDYYRLRGVDVQISPNVWRNVRRFTFTERNIYRPFNFTYVYGITNIMFRIIASKIYFIPTPTFPFNAFRIWYVPSVQKIQSVSDTIDDWGGGFEQYAVCYATIQAKMKSESDYSGNAQELLMLKDRILEMSDDRDFSEPDRIADNRSQAAQFPFGTGSNFWV